MNNGSYKTVDEFAGEEVAKVSNGGELVKKIDHLAEGDVSFYDEALKIFRVIVPMNKRNAVSDAAKYFLSNFDNLRSYSFSGGNYQSVARTRNENELTKLFEGYLKSVDRKYPDSKYRPFLLGSLVPAIFDKAEVFYTRK